VVLQLEEVEHRLVRCANKDPGTMQPRRRSDPGKGSAPARYPGTFLLAFREAAAGIGWQVRRWKGALVECVDGEGKEHVVGLENLFRRARQAERETWPALIADFLSTVSNIDPDENLPENLEAVARQLLVRLGPPIKQVPRDATVWSQEVPGTDFFINLVVDYPNRMCYVTDRLVEESGRAGNHWLEVALTNLQTGTPADCFQVVDADSGLRICSVADAYDSSRALLLDRLLPETAADGCFVSLPGRDSLFVLPVGLKALAQVHLLKVLAEKNYQSAPYPISDEVYWVRGGVWRRFPINIKGDQINVEPPGEFAPILERLAPEDQEETQT
jgi:hypothetical protein